MLRTLPISAALSLLLISLCRGAGAPRTGGFSPEEARARMVVPKGFSVKLFAGEPAIRQPVAGCFDERGRMWVIEYLQYPNPAGLKPVKVDEYLRTEYDRVPPPPPYGPRGADRIKILEDTTGTGKADKVTVFLDGLNIATGIAVGYGGVFVAQPPYLLFYSTKHRDNRPDGNPEVLLTGFGLQDTHATVNSLTWGPDGWLYGAQGSTVTARIRGIEFQQGIWRYHPITRNFELFAEGGGNTRGLDFDLEGNAFGSSNGGFVVFHMVQGGYYWKGFAKHGALHNPRAYGYFNAVAYHGPKAGGHVTTGGIVYKGDTFPAAFRGSLIGGNLLANTVYWHYLDPDGSTFSARHGGTLIDARDTWFRPVGTVAGPDGSIYVLDWYDKRASHLDPRDTWDRSNGRIFKIEYQGTRPVKPFNLATLPSDHLVALRSSSNDWWPAMARRLLAERRDPSVIPALKRWLLEPSGPAAGPARETLALRDLWALYVSGGLDEPTALKLLDDPRPGVRRWTIRLLGDDHRMDPALRARLIGLARTEPDPTVRSQLASSCQRWTAADALPILARLVVRAEDRADPHIPLLLWWALERQMRTDREGVVRTLEPPAVQASPLVRDVLLERLARALASGATDADFRACARLLAAAPGAPEVDRLIAGMEKGLEGRRLQAVPPALQGPLERIWDGRTAGVSLIRFAVRLGSRPAYRAALQRVADPQTPQADRMALIEVLGQLARPDSLATLLHLFRENQPQALHLAIMNALGGFGRPEVAAALLARYPSLGEPLRDRARDLLCSRKDWAGDLLEAIGRGRVKPQDLRTAQVLQIVQLGDPRLVERIEKVWGRVPGPDSAAKKRRIAEVRGILPEGDKGNAARGRIVFRENCAACHSLYGEGNHIGPDLTGADRGNLDFLLTSIVDPSAVIRKEYTAYTVALADGRILTGLVAEQTDRTITLLDSKQQRTVIPLDRVDAMKPSPVSLMPEGLLDKLRDDQVRDLFKYLQSGPPAPRPPKR